MFKTKSELITEGLRESFQTTDCKMATPLAEGVWQLYYGMGRG